MDLKLPTSFVPIRRTPCYAHVSSQPVQSVTPLLMACSSANLLRIQLCVPRYILSGNTIYPPYNSPLA